MGETPENPLKGAGEEMLPDRGLPVDDALTEAEALLSEAGKGKARDLTPEEVEALAAAGSTPSKGSATEEAPGMRAVEPILTDEEFAALPKAETDLPPEETAGTEETVGMHAVEPILTDEEAIGLPKEEPPLPPSASTRGMPPFQAASLSAPGPVEGLPGGEAPEGSHALAASQAMVDMLVTEPLLRAMWKRADSAQRAVNQRIHSLTLARQLLGLIERARNEILAGRDHYEEAERALSEVEYRLALTERVQRWSYTYGLGILAYELLWLVALALVGINLDSIVNGWFAPAVSNNPSLLSNITIGAISVLWGGLGGVVGALYALWRHVARLQDFSKQYTMWYITNPIMGTTLGAFIFLVIRAGMFSLTAGTGGQEISSAFAIYVLAWVAGFQQNVALDIVRRILRVLRLEEKTGLSDQLTGANTTAQPASRRSESG